MTADTIRDIRRFATMGSTDAQIAVLLGLNMEAVKTARHRNRIPAGRSRTPMRTVGQEVGDGPLAPAEILKLRAREAAAVSGAPAKRGLCKPCAEWQRLTSRGVLPEHTRRLRGVARSAAPRCDQSGHPPYNVDATVGAA